MKYEREEALEEIMRRGKQIKKEHDRRVTHLLSMATFITTVALMGVLGVYVGGSSEGIESAYGSFLLSPEAGGYVLTAVIAFVLGVLVTVLIKRFKNGEGIERDPSK